VRRLLRTFPFTIAAILVLTGGIAFAAHSVFTTTTGPVPPGSPGDPMTAGKTPIGPAGLPAITPSLVGRVPAFTDSDVRTYLTTHGFPLGRTASGSPHIVCLVTFAGPIIAAGKAAGGAPPFVMSGQPTPTPQGPIIYTAGYMVFDATTGNLLIAVI
jgi:hypothetical protein